jgi:ABC-type transporter Mla subunit MlaD
VWAGLVGGLLLAVGGMAVMYLAPDFYVPTDAYTVHAFQASGLPTSSPMRCSTASAG